MWILGINNSNHNASACLLKDEIIVCAIQEERLTRLKRAGLSWPRPKSIDYCLNYAGITLSDIDLVVGCGLEFQSPCRENIENLMPNVPVFTIGHHQAHAAGAYALSGFRDAMVVVIDGAGANLDDVREELTVDPIFARFPNAERWLEIVSVYQASQNSLEPVIKVFGDWLSKPGNISQSTYGSLGSMYDVAAVVSFQDPTVAGKVMGLAPYGKPFLDPQQLVSFKDGTFFFPNDIPSEVFQHKPYPEDKTFHQDLAASVQMALEHVVPQVMSFAKEAVGEELMVYTGGTALNSVLNEKLVIDGAFKDIFFMPAADDSGNCIGAAFTGLWSRGPMKVKSRAPYVHDSFGREYSDFEIQSDASEIPNISLEPCSDSIAFAAEALSSNQIIGWFRECSELGPRALGHRSILCSATLPNGKDIINSRVKFREPFRPFAPIVLDSALHEYFSTCASTEESRFMLRVMPVREGKAEVIPATTHVDGTGRVQTVNAKKDPALFQLIEGVKQRTGVPVILNTSFNLRGEPIVERPAEALRCLLFSDLDCVVFEGYIAYRSEQKVGALEMQLYPTEQSYEDAQEFEKNFLDALEKEPGITATELFDSVSEFADWKREKRARFLSRIERSGFLRLAWEAK